MVAAVARDRQGARLWLVAGEAGEDGECRMRGEGMGWEGMVAGAEGRPPLGLLVGVVEAGERGEGRMAVVRAAGRQGGRQGAVVT